MCLIIHKPAAARICGRVLESASRFNPDGFGLMALAGDSEIRIVRRTVIDAQEIQALCDAHAELECVVHLRYRTHGAVTLENTHPLQVTDGVYLMHNGILRVDQRETPQSDTWHFINDYLRPILLNRPEVLHERAFHQLLLAWGGPGNRFVFMDARRRRTVIVNREAGVQADGLWLSNTRWFDASQFDWYRDSVRKAQPLPNLRFLN